MDLQVENNISFWTLNNCMHTWLKIKAWPLIIKFHYCNFLFAKSEKRPRFYFESVVYPNV